jgi:NAD-dependent dihydropyrimidine dehydrogenase PreA subunit
VVGGQSEIRLGELDKLAEGIREKRAILRYAYNSAYDHPVSHILPTEHVPPPPAEILGSYRCGSVRAQLFAAWLWRERPVTYIIAEPCVDVLDKACIEECPVDCIYEGNRMLYIHPDECVDCGACEPVCPVEAIFYEDDVPEQWKDYTNANYEFFEDLGSPGGAAKVGKIDKDASFVVAQPPGLNEH